MNAFNVFDLDKDDSIKIDELYQALWVIEEPSTSEELRNII